MIMVWNISLRLMKLQSCVWWFKTKWNTTGYYKTNRSAGSSLSALSLNSSLLSLTPADFSPVILQTASKVLIDFILHWWYSWHTFKLQNSEEKKRFKTLQSKEITFQVFGGKPPCHMTIRTGFGFQHRRFSGFSHSLLQVAVRLLWRSAHMSPIGACGFETNEHQLAPEVTKGCNMSRNSSIRVCVVIGFVIVFSSSTIQTTQVRWSTRC